MQQSVWLLGAKILLLVLFGVNLYRAATQSITTDEAYTYNRSVVTPIPDLWRDFDANDHVLHTLFCKLTTQAFGVSEFTLRMPALAGGVLYFWTVFALCRMLFRDGPFLLLAVASLTLNPLMLDYCSIARGYGMATALLLFAFYHMLRFQESVAELWRLHVVGFALALAAAANLTVILPGTVLVLVFTAWYLGSARKHRSRLVARFDHLLNRLVIPGVVTASTLLLIPLLPAKRESFYVGSTEFIHFPISLVYACWWRPANLLEHTAFHAIVENACLLAGKWIFPALGLVLAGFAFARRKIDVTQKWLLATLLVTAAVQVLLHHSIGLLYPERRTGLYYVPLLTLSFLALTDVSPRVLKAAGLTLALAAIGMFLISWNTRFYDEWLFDASTKDLMHQVRSRYGSRGPIRMSASWPLLHGVTFYRNLYRLDWLELPPANSTVAAGYDLYLLTPSDWSLMERWRLQLVVEHPFTGVRLASYLPVEPQSTP
ncbi:MAG: hypothetical protein NZV14_12865 [Bryobacteraceae bacterium]|nr:hypothetical protein [Bryobacteraceae bacterium]MDW8379047.1 hypothetical protein [Bryobacterales bacterium]